MRFLEVIIDEHLNWNEHIKQLRSRLSRSVGLLRHLQKCLNTRTLVMLYNAFLLPHLNYCSTVWSNTSQSNLRRLRLLQKAAVRVLSFAKHADHTTPLFTAHGILPFDKLMIYNQLIFTYKSIHLLVPYGFEGLVYNNDVHHHQTRTADKLHMAYHRTNLSKFNFSSVAIRRWDTLPLNLQNLPSLQSFKTNLKQTLLKEVILGI